MVLFSGMALLLYKKALRSPAGLQNPRQPYGLDGRITATLLRSMHFIAAIPLAPLLATVAMASACAVLSIFVIARRWALIGEGISHSGFGGAGVAWLLVLIVP